MLSCQSINANFPEVYVCLLLACKNLMLSIATVQHQNSSFNRVLKWVERNVKRDRQLHKNVEVSFFLGDNDRYIDESSKLNDDVSTER